jgi:heme/copper-type cytochrome/quinol oxidase subunit 4
MCKLDGQHILSCLHIVMKLHWPVLSSYNEINTQQQQQKINTHYIKHCLKLFFPFFPFSLVIGKSFELSLNFVFIFVASVMNVVQ